MNAKIKSQVTDHVPAADTENEGAESQVLRIAGTTRPSAVIPGLAAAQAIGYDGQSGVVTLRFGAHESTATLHPSVEFVVVQRAIDRRELVVVQQQADGWLVIGVLRTSATPGLDVGDDYVVEARRITVKAEHELVLSSGVARLVLAAVGRIESIAKHITSRASGVHKIIGRAIQLN